MDKIFNPKTFEDEIFNFWLESKSFDIKDNNKELFFIILPPPNITGKLHLGHAWDGTIQDTMIRYKKLKGFNSFWIAGMDHAGIATQTKFENYLKDNKISKDSYTRNEFMNEIRKWSSINANEIRCQWKKMGFALDYKHEQFTLSEDNSNYINDVFYYLYKNDYIYRDYKLVNWDIKLNTAISNIEVISKEVETKLYFIFYKLENSNKKLIIATTRPETMFADTCLVVNPNDERYNKLIGTYAINPSNDRKIKIIADDYVSIDYGTGIMKCTPAHDFNDYNIGLKYKQEFYSCINYDGTMNSYALEFEGLDRLICRKLLIKKLTENNCIEKIIIQKSNINFSERSNEIIEPLLSLQWFMKMKKIANEIKEEQKLNKEISFFPIRFENDLFNWLDKIEDWCISRQLIWGHRIPAWFNKNTNKTYVGPNKPEGNDWEQDNDVFDTWFSSGMWPILATKHLFKSKKFMPSNLLVTGYDILFFWVARMIIFSRILKNNIPFNDIFIHGLIRDSSGKKMSKSLNNGIDPMDIIDKYGADALRLFLISSSTIGEDLIYSEEKIISMSSFLNKIWNIANFINMRITNKSSYTSPDIFDLWIMNKFNNLIDEYNRDLEKYNFVVATSKLLKFVKNDFSNYYIELNKWKTNNDYFNYLISDIFKKILILLHPICPFTTEKIFQTLFSNKSILDELWSQNYSCDNEQIIDKLLMMIEMIRKYKWENKINPKIMLDISIHLNKDIYDLFSKNKDYILNILSLEKVNIKDFIKKENDNKFDNDFHILDFCTIEYFYEINKNQENEKINKEILLLESEILRSENMLNNKNFILKAPNELVNLEKNKLEDNINKLKELKFQLDKN